LLNCYVYYTASGNFAKVLNFGKILITKHLHKNTAQIITV